MSFILDSERHFQIWKYTVSHSQLLLRSTKSSRYPTRIDILFKGVKSVHLPTSFDKLVITEESSKDVHKFAPLGYSENEKLFVMQGVGFAGYVAASVIFVHEDDGEYNEPSFFAQKDPSIEW